MGELKKYLNYHSSARGYHEWEERTALERELGASLLPLLELEHPENPPNNEDLIVIDFMLAFADDPSENLPKHELSRRYFHGFRLVRVFVDKERYVAMSAEEWVKQLRWCTLAALVKYAPKLGLRVEPLAQALADFGPEPADHCFGMGPKKHDRPKPTRKRTKRKVDPPADADPSGGGSSPGKV